MAAPTNEEKDDVLLAARYGDLEDIQRFVENFGSESLVDVRDDNENSLLHMACANGHLDVLEYLLPIVAPSLLASQNSSLSTPLHWAALNSHLEIAKALVECQRGPGVDLIDIKNAAGRTPLGEAELAGWDEGAAWFVKVMKLDAAGIVQETSEDADVDGPADAQDIEVEIQDADGQVAKMTISGTAKTSSGGDARSMETLT